MPASKIMLIRHAEKPGDDTDPDEYDPGDYADPGAGTDGKKKKKILGVDWYGTNNKEELIVRGWQRSGGLVGLFKPRDGNFVEHLAQPNIIFAAGAPTQSDSLRPQHTVAELANVLRLTLQTKYLKGDEDDLAKAAVNATGTVLIAWQHQDIPDIVNAIVGNDTTCPQKWPGSRFDLVWVLDATPSGGWSFNQVPQLLLSGDSDKPIHDKPNT
jgi:hypothetical protein